MSADPTDEVRTLMHQLDRVLPPHSSVVGSTGGDALLEAAQRLAQGPRAALSPAAQDRIEQQLRARVGALQAAAQTAAQPVPPEARSAVRRAVSAPVWRGLWSGWQTWAAALLVVLVVGLLGVTRASANSLPGDTLYPLKRTIEGARLALASDESAVGLRLDFAHERFSEFERLLARDRVDPGVLRDGARDLTAAVELVAAGAGDPVEVQARVDGLIERHSAMLAQAEAVASRDEWAQLQPPVAEIVAAQLVIDALAARETQPDAAPVPAAIPSDTPTPSPTPTLAPTPTLTPTPTSSLTPSALETAPDRGPTRTPPGHGPTPGLGQSPPGQGGANPGVGNNGNPPGQNKGR